MAGQKKRGSRQRRRLGPGNRIGSFIIFVVAFMALLASVIRIITIRQDQAVYDEKEAYYTQLVEEETKRAEDLVEFEKYTQTTAYRTASHPACFLSRRIRKTETATNPIAI